MKIVYMGTPDFAVGALEAIIEAGHEVVAVVTQPDRAKGRSDKLVFSPVKEVAVKNNIPVLQPERIRRPEAIEELRQYPADIFVVAAFGQILPKEVLEMPKFGCVNIHASLLPFLRGAAPIQYSILEGHAKSGVTIMQMDEGLDTGDILIQEAIPITHNDTGGSLFDKLAELGAKLIVKALPMIENGEITPIPQDETKATHVGMLSKSMGCIDFSKPAEKIELQVRALDPWPGTFTTFNGKQLKIWHCGAISMLPNEPAHLAEIKNAEPGTIIEVYEDVIYVQTGDGILRIDEIQLEGKKRMNVRNFLLGNKVFIGDKLGE